jgi:hypothetical protein
MPDWTLNLSSEQAADFLRSLAEDDAFRSRLQSAPEQAFAEKGIPAPPEAIEGPITLPPKDDLIRTFSAAFPHHRRGSILRRLIAHLWPGPIGPPFGHMCKGWALCYLFAARLEKPSGR